MQAIGEYWRKLSQEWLEPLFKANVLNTRVIWVGVIGILLLIFGSYFSGETNERRTDTSPAVQAPSAAGLSQQEIMEQRLAHVLSKVKGAGQVSVAVTLDGSKIQEHAKNVVKETKIVEEKDTSGGVRTTSETKENEQVLLSKESGADKPVMVREADPEVKGVLIVAEGASDSAVKSNLVRAVEAGLGIASYKVTVLPQRR